MKIRKTFLISWLVSLNKEQTESSVIDIEHVQSRNHTRVPTLEEAIEWMRKAGELREDAQVHEGNW